MVDGQSTDKLKVGNFSEQVWGDLRERDHEYTKAELAKVSPAPTVTISVFVGGARPFGLAFDPAGDLWVANGLDVVEFSKAELAKTGSPAPVSTLIDVDCSIAFDPLGDLWEGIFENALSEFSNAQLARPASAAGPAVTISSDSLDSSCKPAFDRSGNLWVTNFNSNTVVEFTKAQLARSGLVAPKVTISLSQNGDPGALALDSSGDLWVPTEVQNSVADYTNAQLTKSGSPVPAEPFLVQPQG